MSSPTPIQPSDENMAFFGLGFALGSFFTAGIILMSYISGRTDCNYYSLSKPYWVFYSNDPNPRR